MCTIKEFSAKEKRSKDDDPSRQKMWSLPVMLQICFLLNMNLSTWDPELSTKLQVMEKTITVDSCICHACEKDIERKINSGDYVPGWTLQNKENITLMMGS